MAINLTDKLYAATGSQVIADAIQVAGGYMAITSDQRAKLTPAQKVAGTLVYETDTNKTYRYIETAPDTYEWIELVQKQGDWNQNDETAPDYIKNRTHYEIKTGDIETILAIDGDYDLASLVDLPWEGIDLENVILPTGSFVLQEGDIVEANIEGQSISGVAVYNEADGTIYVPSDDYGDNFFWAPAGADVIFTWLGADIGYGDPTGESPWYWPETIYIKIIIQRPAATNKIITLDEKYIPDTIAKVVDIKNGTYFTEAEKYDILVDTTTINVEAEDFYYRTTQSPFTAQIIDGNKYLVIFDEVSYICYGRKYNKMNDTLSNCFDYCLIGDVVFNNGNYSRPISGSNLPFCIVNDYFENTNDFTADVLVFGDTASTHTIKIVDVTPTVKKLPEEFLADNFKAVTKGFGEKSAIFGLGQEASGELSIAAGQSTVASGWMSIALGLASKASGAAALTLGQLAEASGTLAVAHGFNTKASGAAAVAAGDGTIAGSECQLVHGKFNIEDTADTYAHIVGGGENNMNRKNIYALDWTGNASFAGQVAASSIKIGNTTFTEAQLTKILKFIESIEEVNN